MDIEALVRFSAVAIALYGLHDVADHWVQRPCDAQHKGDPGWTGRLHCLSHVLSYGATQALGIVALWAAFGLDLNPLAFAAGMAFNLGTHYIADRRTPLRWVASLLPGKLAYHDNGGQYHLDQSWHRAAMFVSALLCAL